MCRENRWPTIDSKAGNVHCAANGISSNKISDAKRKAAEKRGLWKGGGMILDQDEDGSRILYVRCMDATRRSSLLVGSVLVVVVLLKRMAANRLQRRARSGR